MSEKLSQSPEHKSESLDLSAESKRNLERINKAALESESQQAEISELQDIVENKAASTKEIGPVDKVTNDKYIPGLHKALKSESYKRSLKNIQSKLSGPERVASKVIHKPIVDSTSNALAKTVAKPSGILGAGIMALVGSSVLLYMAKHYGFTYNFFVFFILLGIGFLAGVVLELVIRAIKKPSR